MTTPTKEQIAGEAVKLWCLTRDFEHVADLMDKYEAQGVSRATALAVIDLAHELLAKSA